jgi:hypothetical protein
MDTSGAPVGCSEMTYLSWISGRYGDLEGDLVSTYRFFARAGGHGAFFGDVRRQIMRITD